MFVNYIQIKFLDFKLKNHFPLFKEGNSYCSKVEKVKYKKKTGSDICNISRNAKLELK